MRARKNDVLPASPLMGWWMGGRKRVGSGGGGRTTPASASIAVTWGRWKVGKERFNGIEWLGCLPKVFFLFFSLLYSFSFETICRRKSHKCTGEWLFNNSYWHCYKWGRYDNAVPMDFVSGWKSKLTCPPTRPPTPTCLALYGHPPDTHLVVFV